MSWAPHIYWAIKAKLGLARPTQVPPSPAEQRAALAALDASLRPAVFGKLGGTRPNKENRASSWWGGNFLGAPGETIPRCNVSGRDMHPILQIRTDELLGLERPLDGAALVTFWLDLESGSFWRARDGEGFNLRVYDSLEGLVPLGPGYRDSDALPTFPVIWEPAIQEQPDWEDMAGRVPSRVAWANKDDWFFGSKTALACYEIRATHPVQIGGWPQWIQGSEWPKDAKLLFQIDSTDKGGIGFGDSGSVYLFLGSEGFEIRGDCY